MQEKLKQKFLTPNTKNKSGLTRAELAEIAEAGRKDFWFFCKHILGQAPGLQDLAEQPHRWMCGIAQKWGKRKKLILTPRDSFKTTILAVCYCVWEIMRDPNITILLTAYAETHSKNTLYAIKHIFETHAFFRACYGDFVGTEKWTNNEIVVSKRTSTGDRAATITTGGTESGSVGAHFKLIIFDDPHYEKNITTPEQIKKVIQYYRGLLPIMDAKCGRLMIIATRWHQSDIHNHIFTNEKSSFDIYVRKAYWEKNGKTYYFFPSRLNKEYLENKKKELGTYFFACQFLNDPIDEELAHFKRSQFRYFSVQSISESISEELSLDKNCKIVYSEGGLGTKTCSIPIRDLKFFVCIDPAGRGTIIEIRRLDYTGIIVCGIDAEKNWYIFEAIKRRGMKPSDIIELVFKLHAKYDPEVIGIEEITWQGQLKDGVLREAKKTGIFPRVQELKPGGRNKDVSRIMGLQPLYEARVIFHNEGLFDLEDELLRWTVMGNQHDDLIDAEAYLKDIIYPPDKTEVTQQDIPQLHESPGLLISADQAWRKEGGGMSFQEFLEDTDPRDFEKMAVDDE